MPAVGSSRGRAEAVEGYKRRFRVIEHEFCGKGRRLQAFRVTVVAAVAVVSKDRWIDWWTTVVLVRHGMLL